MSRRVLITGATGLIGRGVVSALDDKTEIFYTARSNQELPYDRFIPFDFSQTSQISHFLSLLKPKVIVHTAAVTSIADVAQNPTYAERVNVDAVREIANWCAANDARMIHFSTDFVFEGKRADYSETDVPSPISTYGRLKRQSELAVKDVLENHFIIRPILVYGHFKQIPRLNFPLLVIDKLSKGEVMFVTSDQVRMPTHVTDLASVVKEALFSEHTGFLHIAGPELINMYDFALKVAGLFGLDPKLLRPVKTTNEIDGEHRPMTSGFNLQKARTLFNYEPKSIEEGLRLLTFQ
jgi:dTDP-4-dehydrorhamnose reductase